MKGHAYIYLPFLLLLALPAAGNTNITTREHDVSYCYAYAMIGKDSVINSRLGLLPEQLIHHAKLNATRNDVTPRYSPVLLKAILGAFLWKESPQSYAHAIFESCDEYRA